MFNSLKVSLDLYIGGHNYVHIKKVVKCWLNRRKMKPGGILYDIYYSYNSITLNYSLIETLVEK